jgi:secreted trypsin-like serine protease
MWSKARSCAAVAALIAAMIALIEPGVAQEGIKPFNRRIVGGVKTDIKEHPWQVALRFKGTFSCGGSIIAQRWVLTAAHCFGAPARGADWRVKAGATNHQTSGTWAEVERVIVHAKFNPTTFENDIALIKLKAPAAGKVIPLADAAATIGVGQPLEVTGWGATKEDGDGSSGLLKANVPYVDPTKCNEPESHNGSIRPSMMCAGQREGGIDSCQGDSGGPLVWRTPDGPVLVGVVSFGEGCARKLKYGVYTRVSAYRSWIDSAIAADR